MFAEAAHEKHIKHSLQNLSLYLVSKKVSYINATKTEKPVRKGNTHTHTHTHTHEHADPRHLPRSFLTEAASVPGPAPRGPQRQHRLGPPCPPGTALGVRRRGATPGASGVPSVRTVQVCLFSSRNWVEKRTLEGFNTKKRFPSRKPQDM